MHVEESDKVGIPYYLPKGAGPIRVFVNEAGVRIESARKTSGREGVMAKTKGKGGTQKAPASVETLATKRISLSRPGESSPTALLDATGKCDSVDSCRCMVREGRISESYMKATNGGAISEDCLKRPQRVPDAKPGLGPEDEPKPDPGSMHLQNVIGDDDRVLISDTSLVPARSVGLLAMFFETGHTLYATAWLVGPQTLATAAHNIYHPDFGQVQRIRVAMAYDGRNPPHGWFDIHDVEIPSEWLGAPVVASPYDYAVLKFPDAALANRLGWFGYADYHDEKFLDLKISIIGYPLDDRVYHYHLYGSEGRVQHYTDTLLHYDCDAGGGMSGAPVIARFGDQRIAVGIHAAGGGGVAFNVGTRIGTIAYRLFDKFRVWT